MIRPTRRNPPPRCHGWLVYQCRVPPYAFAALLLVLSACGKAPKETGHVQPTAFATAGFDQKLDATTQPAPLAVPPAPKPTAPLASDATCVTSACHARFANSRHIHGPVAAGACSACHLPDAGGHRYPLRRGSVETCTFCHQVVGTLPVQHAAVASATCLGCHDAHASATKFLLREPNMDRLCGRCHDVPLQRFAHDPFATGACTVCHEPHQAQYKSLLRGGEGPQECFTCHSDMQRKMALAPFTHKPAVGGCVTCHSPHATEFPDQLKMPIEKTCASCHQDLEAQATGARSPHAAVFTASSCANCHDPHAAGRANLLRDREDRLCLTCHDKPVQATDGRTLPSMKALIENRRFLHGPVRSGNCTACHDAHGSSHAALLRRDFPKAFYARFDLENYALCFSCHDKALVLTENTTALTEFRDGQRNLHYLHVNRAEKGRTCKACHDIHGSDQPNHMADQVPFEGSPWALPIQFEKTADGGRCAPGCHEPKSYQRGPATPAASAPAGGLP